MATEKGSTCDLKLIDKTYKHENSEKHVNNSLHLALLGSVDVRQRLSKAYEESIQRHNNQMCKTTRCCVG